MRKNRRTILAAVAVCLLMSVGYYGYSTISERSSFAFSQINWAGETKFWTDNTMNNVYNIDFQYLDGTDLKEIVTKKSTYEMKIDFKVESGELGLKIYNDKKVLLDTKDSFTKTISVSREDSKNVMVELTGKKAKGHVKITLS